MAVYDYHGNIISLDVSTDKTLKNADVAADSKTVGDIITKSDIPCLYITGGALPVSKDDGKVKFAIQYVSNTETFSEYCTLKPQGDSSLAYPKKNFNIVFYKASDFKKKSKHNFKDWGEQSKYTLKANWADPTQSRNVVTANIWADTVRQRSNYSELPTEMLGSPNLSVIDGFPVRVFWNGVYLGRYTFNIPKDPWMYNMDDELETNVVLYSEGRSSNNTATGFREEVKVNGLDWSDEIHEDEVPQSVVDNFNRFIRFVIDSTDSQFMSNLENYADVESIIDVIILAWVDAGIDSLNKNQIFMSYDGVKYYASVYDLDSTWGMNWSGEIVNPYDLPIDYVSYVGNNLYDRVRSLFANRLKKRYAFLRTNALSEANISKRFDEFSKNMSRELIEQDWAETTANGKYTEIPSKEESTIPRILEFASKRLEYLDEVLSNAYPKIVVNYQQGNNIVFLQDGLGGLKQYLTITYYENENDAGTIVDSSEYVLIGTLIEGDCKITVRYNGFVGYFTASITDYYNQFRWSYPNGNSILQVGYNSRATIWGQTHLTMQPRGVKYNAVVQRGIRPFYDHETHDPLGVYPIPIPRGVNKITVTVVPSNIEVKMSLWENYGGAGRYSRSQQIENAGMGTAIWSEIPRSELYDEFLCVEFFKTGGTIANNEITSYNISYEIVNAESGN